MREDIRKNLDYLELGEDSDICHRVSLIREYIKELNSKIERQQVKTEILEMIIIHLFRKEILKDEKS